ARRNLDPQELATALDKMTEIPSGAQSRSYLFLGCGRNGAGDQRTASMAVAPSSQARTKQLLRLAGSNPGAGSTRYDRPSRKGRFALIVFVTVLAMILLPLVVALIGLVGYLTLIVMTLALAAGLSLVVALV